MGSAVCSAPLSLCRARAACRDLPLDAPHLDIIAIRFARAGVDLLLLQSPVGCALHQSRRNRGVARAGECHPEGEPQGRPGRDLGHWTNKAIAWNAMFSGWMTRLEPHLARPIVSSRFLLAIELMILVPSRLVNTIPTFLPTVSFQDYATSRVDE